MPSTFAATTINIITGGLGAGILSLPWAMAGASVISALIMNAIVLGLNSWTIMLIINAGEKYQKFDLGSLLEMLPGKVGKFSKIACNLVIWFSMFLCLVGYMIVIQDGVVKVLESFSSDVPPTVPAHTRPISAIVASVVLIPLCFLPMSSLSITSSLAVIMNAFLFSLVLYLFYDVDWIPQNNPCLIGFTSGTFTFFSALMFSVIIQMCVLPMYEQLEHRSPQQFQKIVNIAFSFLFLFTSAMGTTVYLLYGSETNSNFLNNLPSTKAYQVATNIAQAGMVLVILGVYPIMVNPMVAPIAAYEDATSGEAYQELTGKVVSFGSVQAASRSRRLYSSGATVAIVLCALAVSCISPGGQPLQLGLLNVVNGAMSVTMFVAFCPSMVALYLGDPASVPRRLALYGLFVFGIVMSVMGFIFTDNNACELVANCPMRLGPYVNTTCTD